ncbi:hypothetical protein [Burkholderia cenocepacia]|uniref:hypothetical protein n=1 Tax=Burkholderia cenocepacia TaxID=95486 RepID=UPI000AD3D495|nr:hypothetical protein [Burkholderia cenocepacia]MBR7981884.1 hypothetical protein [Burkholderia cenocepacia]
MHDVIEATRKFILKRTSISKNNRKFLPRSFLIKSAGFPECGGNGDFFGRFTLSARPLRAGMPGRRPELFFTFLFPADATAENSPG